MGLINRRHKSRSVRVTKEGVTYDEPKESSIRVGGRRKKKKTAPKTYLKNYKVKGLQDIW